MLATATSVRPSWPGAAAGCVLFIASVSGGRFDGEVAGGAGANSVDRETLREPTAGFAAVCAGVDCAAAASGDVLRFEDDVSDLPLPPLPPLPILLLLLLRLSSDDDWLGARPPPGS